jgi:NTE family protein
MTEGAGRCLSGGMTETRRRGETNGTKGALAALMLAGGDGVESFALPGGAALLEAGETSGMLYMLRTGRLAAIERQAGASPRLLNLIWPGEGIGEISLLADIPHTASVVALRDSELLAMSRASFLAVAEKEPVVMLELVRMLIRRQLQPSVARGPTTFGFAAAHEGVDVRSFSEELAGQVRAFGSSVIVVDAAALTQTTEWFCRLEEDHDYLFYVAEPGEREWAAICARQSDWLFQLARGDAPPRDTTARSPPISAPLKRTDLVLLHAKRLVPPLCAALWREAVSAECMHHVCEGDFGDLARLARHLTGRSTALVLSGGGARGYAHIGAIRALREHGVPLDYVGGTSMGAVIAAGVACGWNDEEMEARVREAFVDSNPLGDIGLPMLALARGLEVEKRLATHFGDCDISDLWSPFFAVSSDLTRGAPVLHDRGSLVQALRASIALPGILPPVASGNTVLVDGGVMRNLPADMMRAVHAGPIVAVDVSIDAGLSPRDLVVPPSLLRWFLSGEWRKGPPIISLLLRSATVTAERDLMAARQTADVLILPKLDSVEIRNWKAFEPAASAGYAAAREALDKLEVPVTELRLVKGSS